MSKCLNCDKFNALADENEKILKEYNLLKLKYNRYDMICYDFSILGFAIGVIVTLILLYFLTKL